MKRCDVRAPSGHDFAGERCGLHAGHDGEHTVLASSNAPWFTTPNATESAPLCQQRREKP